MIISEHVCIIHNHTRRERVARQLASSCGLVPYTICRPVNESQHVGNDQILSST